MQIHKLKLELTRFGKMYIHQLDIIILIYNFMQDVTITLKITWQVVKACDDDYSETIFL